MWAISHYFLEGGVFMNQFEINEVTSVEATGMGILVARGLLTAGGWILIAAACC
jgi:hypothetical protein